MPLTTDSEAAQLAFLEALDHAHNVQLAAARDAADAALAEDADFALALTLRGRLSQSADERARYMKKAKALRAEVSESERHFIDMYAAYGDGDTKGAMKACKALAEAHPDDPNAQFMLGQMYLGMRESDKALQALTRTTALDPDFAAAYNLLGYRAMYEGDMDAAESAFTRYVALRPNDANPHDSLAEFYLKAGRYDEAVTSYKNAYAADDRYVGAWTRAGIVTALDGKTAAARTELKKAMEAASDPSEKAQIHIALAQTHLYDDDIDGAANAFDDAVAWARTDSPERVTYFLMQKGWVMHENERLDEARATIQAVQTALDDGLVPASLREGVEARLAMAKGFAAIDQGDDDAARAYMKTFKAYATKTGDPEAMETLYEMKAYRAHKAGRVEEAIAHMKNAGDAPMTHYHLGRLYREMGDIDKAQAHLTKAATANELSLSYAIARNHATRALAM